METEREGQRREMEVERDGLMETWSLTGLFDHLTCLIIDQAELTHLNSPFPMHCAVYLLDFNNKTIRRVHVCENHTDQQ